MAVLYPLRFQPILRRYLWGGRRLESLGKSLGPGSDYAESWEIVDRGDDQSVVEAGAFAGKKLGELVTELGAELLGQQIQSQRFPLLFKFLDAEARLSLQVHPDDRRAARLDPPDFGKTEAWVILDTSPTSFLYAGLREGINRTILQHELSRRTVELCCARIEPRIGDCFFLPAGVVHALGAGLLVAEIQQASDTTYRLYDFDRIGPDGKPRPLHVAEALEAIDYSHGPVRPQTPVPIGTPGIERLVACDQFVLDRWSISGEHRAGGDGRFHILAVLAGELEVSGDAVQRPLTAGGVILLPAGLPPSSVRALGKSIVLDTYLP